MEENLSAMSLVIQELTTFILNAFTSLVVTYFNILRQFYHLECTLAVSIGNFHSVVIPNQPVAKCNN